MNAGVVYNEPEGLTSNTSCTICRGFDGMFLTHQMLHVFIYKWFVTDPMEPEDANSGSACAQDRQIAIHEQIRFGGRYPLRNHSKIKMQISDDASAHEQNLPSGFLAASLCF